MKTKKYSYFSKMVVDDTRHILYALINFSDSEESYLNEKKITSSSIYYYDLGIILQ